MKRTVLVLVLPLALVAGCSSSDAGAGASATPSAAVTSTAPAEAPAVAETPAASATPPAPTAAAPQGASDIAGAVHDAIDSVTKTEDLTEDTDGNDLLGRPHGYSSATVIFDSHASCVDGPGIDCGTVVEVFDSEADAKARAKYIDGVIAGMGPMFAEYDTQAGPALLRVSGQLKPSLAQQYKAAFQDATA